MLKAAGDDALYVLPVEEQVVHVVDADPHALNDPKPHHLDKREAEPVSGGSLSELQYSTLNKPFGWGVMRTLSLPNSYSKSFTTWSSLSFGTSDIILTLFT